MEAIKKENIAIMRYRVRKENHEQALKVFREYLDYEHAHPEIYHYNKTRYYFMDAPDNPEEEIWMFIDWFDDYNDYVDSLKKSVINNPVAKDIQTRTVNLFVPDSLSEREHWIEAEQLRVDF